MTSMNVTRTRIAHMCGEISGIRTAFVNIPRKLLKAQLPATVVFPGRATHSKSSLGEQMIDETRIYKIVLYVDEAAFGSEGQTELETDPFFDSVLQHFAARPGLELDSEGAQQSVSVLNAQLSADGGLVVGPYPFPSAGPEPSPDYVQIQWDLQVEDIVEINYED